MDTAKLILPGREPVELPIVRGTAGDPAIDITKWQHDLYRFNGLPYDRNEIALMKRFAALDEEREARK